MAQIEIVKQNGEREVFDADKLRASLARTGATSETVEMVVGEVESKLEQGDTTGEIYARAFELLKESERPSAARYSLRRALADLGPSGFPFEYFVAEIFKAKGFTTQTGIILEGTCIEHEVDMLAENENERIAMEIKFHNDHKIKTDVKVALYVKSRFDDLLARLGADLPAKGYLLTNTKFTKNAIKYAECIGLSLVSWSYPRTDNLQNLIEETGLHPVTALTTLSGHDKKILTGAGTVLCRDVRDNTSVLEELGKKDNEIEEIIEEVNMLCRRPEKTTSPTRATQSQQA